MCFYRYDAAKKLKIAETDIPCYKNLNYDFSSSQQGFCYEEGETYDSLLTKFYFWLISIFDCTYVNIGFHSFKNSRYYTGFNQYRKVSLIHVKCWIPKGAWYFEDEHYFVSSAIRMGTDDDVFTNKTYYKELAG